MPEALHRLSNGGDRARFRWKAGEVIGYPSGEPRWESSPGHSSQTAAGSFTRKVSTEALRHEMLKRRAKLRFSFFCTSGLATSPSDTSRSTQPAGTTLLMTLVEPVGL